MTLLARFPRPVEIAFHARADGLHDVAEGMAGHVEKTLEPQDLVLRDELGETRGEARRIGDRGARDDEAFEIVVVVLGLEIVAGRARGDVVLGGGGKAEQHARRQRAVRGADAGYTRPQPLLQRMLGRGKIAPGHQVGLVEDGEIGRHELIAEHFLDRIVVRGRSCARRGDDRACGKSRRVDHRDDAIDCDARLDLGPVQRLEERFRQREAGGFHDDMIRPLRRIEEPRQRRQKILCDGAADAAVRELDHLVAGAGIAAREQQLAIDAELAEFVDEEADAAPFGMDEKMAHEARLARRPKIP